MTKYWYINEPLVVQLNGCLPCVALYGIVTHYWAEVIIPEYSYRCAIIVTIIWWPGANLVAWRPILGQNWPLVKSYMRYSKRTKEDETQRERMPGRKENNVPSCTDQTANLQRVVATTSGVIKHQRIYRRQERAPPRDRWPMALITPRLERKLVARCSRSAGSAFISGVSLGIDLLSGRLEALDCRGRPCDDTRPARQ